MLNEVIMILYNDDKVNDVILYNMKYMQPMHLFHHF